MKIWILYVCTGKYDVFWEEFYSTSEQYFLPNLEKHYFVFTDAEKIFGEENNIQIHRVHQENLGWPNNTMKRFHIFLSQEKALLSMDYLVFFNANMKFLTSISEEEFLPTWSEKYIAVQHPGFYDKPRRKFSYENRLSSQAYIPPNEGSIYVQWALQWGVTTWFLDACLTMTDAIDIDTKNGIVAQWHDESHWNRFLVWRTDIKILSPSYAYPEDWALPFPEKIRMLDKSKFFSIGNVRKYSLVQETKERLYRFLKKHWLL